MTDATAGKPTGTRAPARPDARGRRHAAEAQPRPRAAGAEAAGAAAGRAAAALRRCSPSSCRSATCCSARSRTRSCRDTLPRTVEALADWDSASGELPGEPVFAALHADLAEAVEAKTHTRLGTRLNYESSGISSLFRRAGRDVEDMDPSLPFKRAVPRRSTTTGASPTIWQTIKLFSGPYTAGYLLNAVDMQKTPDGVALQPAARAHLPQALPAHLRAEPGDHRRSACCSATRSPTCWRSCRSAARTC